MCISVPRSEFEGFSNVWMALSVMLPPEGKLIFKDEFDIVVL